MADSVTFRFSGGEQFIVDLGRWRDRLRAEVHEAARHEAFMITSVVADQYPIGRTGKLRAGVRAKDESYGDVVMFRVRTLAAHSHLYEKGTEPRTGPMRTVFIPGVGFRRTTRRGKMPAHPTFIPEAILRRDVFRRSVRRILGSPEPAIGNGSPTVTGSL